MLLMLPFSFEDNQTQRYPQASFAALATISINDVTHLSEWTVNSVLGFSPHQHIGENMG